MPKSRAPEKPNRGARAKKRDATGVATPIGTDSSKPAIHRGRATPGKVLRGSVPVKSVLRRAILDKLDRGIVLLDRNGALVDANSLARDVLKSGDGIQFRGGRFAFADLELDARLVRLINLAGRAGAGPSTIAARIKRPRAAAYRIVVSPIAADADERGVAFVAILYGPSERREINDSVLKELYGLTRAQAKVARRLHAGRSVEETASDLGLSLNTVRTHLKVIFSKCEVQSQAELMHLLALGPQNF
jgi:DNA-binding CsgD family transcriptional regulator